MLYIFIAFSKFQKHSQDGISECRVRLQAYYETDFMNQFFQENMTQLLTYGVVIVLWNR